MLSMYYLLCAALAALTVSVPLVQAAQVTASRAGFPNRQQWTFDHGYCGELSVQSAALTHGVWVSQQKARDLGEQAAPEETDYPGELLLAWNIGPVLGRLGFNYKAWNYEVPVSQSSLQQYMVWVKQQLIEGKVVIFSARLPDDRDTSEWYDHIMPAYGITYNSATAGRYDANDVLMWMDMFRNDVQRALNTPSFYAGYRECKFQTGCIPKDVENLAVAMGGLKDANSLFLPVQLVILNWSDGETEYWEEPVATETSLVEASYKLDISVAGLAPGEKFTVFRCDGEGPLPQNPSSASQLQSAANCKGVSFTMGPDVSKQLTEEALGALYSYSVVYFVGVRGAAGVEQPEPDSVSG